MDYKEDRKLQDITTVQNTYLYFLHLKLNLLDYHSIPNSAGSIIMSRCQFVQSTLKLCVT